MTISNHSPRTVSWLSRLWNRDARRARHRPTPAESLPPRLRQDIGLSPDTTGYHP
jgi:hypothetical protein